MRKGVNEKRCKMRIAFGFSDK